MRFFGGFVVWFFVFWGFFWLGLGFFLSFIILVAFSLSNLQAFCVV